METKIKTDQKVFAAIGRRKEAVARVRLFVGGSGQCFINGKKFEEYFTTVAQRMQVQKPLIVVDLLNQFDVKANVRGGGLSGQAGAVSLGISRCLLSLDANHKSLLKKDSLLTRDPRAKERKKYGRKGARRRFQWTKR